MTDAFMNDILAMPSLGTGYVKLLYNAEGIADDFKFLDINAAFEALTHWKQSDIVNRCATEFFADEDLSRLYWLSFYIRTVSSGKTQEVIQFMKSSGQYLSITAIPVNDTYILLTVRIANRQALPTEQSEETMQLLNILEVMLDNTHEAVSLMELVGGRYRYVRNNALHRKLTGFRHIRGVFLEEVIGEEDAERLSQYYAQCIATGQPVSYEQEFNFKPEKRYLQTQVTPIFGENGIRYLLLFSKDITEYKQIQCKNEQLNRRLQAMFNQHSAIQLICDPNSGHIIDANPAACKFYGYSSEKMRQLMMQDINLLPSGHPHEKFQSERDEQNYASAVPYRLKDGTLKLLDISSCPIDDGERRLLSAIIFDATDREMLRQALLQEKELLHTTLQSIGDGVVTTDGEGIITSLNSVAQILTGWEQDAAVGLPFTEVFTLKNEETGHPVENPIQKVLETGRVVGLANHTELISRNGDSIPIADSAAPIRSPDGQSFGVVMVFRDVSQEKKHNRQIEYLSYHDMLTGLSNRRYIEESMSLWDTQKNLPISVIMGDVNGLKITNDIFGHKTGDSLLRTVADVLRKNCGGDALIARWGGDEFVVFLPRTDLAEAEAIVERIRHSSVLIRESGLHLSLSLGCAVKTSASNTLQSVLRQAEEYMYRQKLLDGKSYRNAIINTLLATLYEKSGETEEHSIRIEWHCHSIGHRLSLSAKELNELSLLALLHDIGKVSIPQHILQKPGPLTSEEWKEMKRHPEIGYRIAQATPELSIVSELILSHHERWDGKGYPHGLAGEDIPLACRILAVSDAFDAMTNERVYRKAMTEQEAIDELCKHAGTQFDPAIVQVFLSLLAERVLETT